MYERKTIDETGNRYDRLLVVRRAERGDRKATGAYWSCRCDCGKTTVTSGSALREGAARSCGCINREILTARYKDETGNRYGRLVVIAFAGAGDYRRGGKQQGAQWRCRCDCGKEHTTRGSSLRCGAVSSCGCLTVDRAKEINRKPHGESMRNHALRQCKRAARERNYEWLLTDEQAFALFVLPCHYCGAIATNHSTHPDANGSFRYNGIDRVDNSQGYTPENCVACCKHCNVAKRSMTVLEFRMWITQVYNHLKLG